MQRRIPASSARAAGAGRHDEPDRAGDGQGGGFDVTYVPFAGGGPSGTALLGGHIEYRVAQPPRSSPT
jgi:tripartite-type tricarboxylate transporter receptor subunit TctC